MIDNKGRFYCPWHRGGVRPWLLGIGLAAALLSGTAGPFAIIAGTCLLLLSMLIQFWSKGCLQQNTKIAQSGPYRFVRHPFYLSNLLLDAGIVAMSGFPPLILLAPLWWLAVYIPSIRTEERHLRTLFGEQYERYLARVPMLVPLGRPLPRGDSDFNWRSRNIRGTETARAIRYLAFPLAFVLATDIFNQGLALTPRQWWISFILAGLWLSSAAWKFHFKYGKPILPTVATLLENRVLYIALIIMAGLVWDVLDPRTDPWLYRFPGILALGISLVTMGLLTRRPLLAEACLAVAMAVLLELQWLVILLIPFYLSLILDTRMLRAVAAGLQTHQPLPIHSYGALVIMGLVSIMITETWI